MVRKSFLGIDQGTSSTKCVLIDAHGELLFEEKAPISFTRKEGTHAEQNPEEILDSVHEVLEAGKAFASDNHFSIDGIGLSCQRSGVTAWERATGKVLHPLISWADTSTEPFLRERSKYKEEILRETTLPFLAHYAAGKFAALQQLFPSDEILIGTLDSFLIWKLTSEASFVTDDSMASRTMLYSLQERSWSERLCEIFSVDLKRLPKILPSRVLRGSVDGIPITASLGDQQSSLYAAHRCGIESVLTMGSISAIAAATPDHSFRCDGFLTNVLISEKEGLRWFIEGITNASGPVVQEIRNKIGAKTSLSEIEVVCNKEGAADLVVYFPAGGTATPQWLSGLPALQTGKGAKSEAAVSALIRNTGNFIIRNLRNLRNMHPTIFENRELTLAGGFSELDYLVQYIADGSKLTLLRRESSESSARGASIAARPGSDPVSAPAVIRKFVPGKFSEARFAAWKLLEEQAISGVLDENTSRYEPTL